MGKIFEKLSSAHQDFIKQQKVFFVATAAAEGSVNLSPKGLDSLHVIDHSSLLWLNLTGSGNETAAHVLKNPRMTLMFCAFEGAPLILRIHGQAEIFQKGHPEFENYCDLFPPSVSKRQVYKVKIDRVITSCGFGVPLMTFQKERTLLPEWADKKGEEGIKQYWKDKNQKSFDGFETDIPID